MLTEDTNNFAVTVTAPLAVKTYTIAVTRPVVCTVMFDVRGGSTVPPQIINEN